MYQYPISNNSQDMNLGSLTPSLCSCTLLCSAPHMSQKLEPWLWGGENLPKK